MRYKFAFFALFFCFTQFAFANTEICPTVDDIKNHNFNGWIPLYIEGEELASEKDMQNFKQNLTDFVVARWDTTYLESGHCFYQGTDPILSKIIFAQDAWKPVQSGKWVWKNSNKIAECYSNNVNDCGFIG